MLRVTFIILQVCSSAQASTLDSQHDCASGDDANSLLQAKAHTTGEVGKRSSTSVASQLTQEIKGIALIGSRGHNTLMRNTLKDIASLADGLTTMTGASDLTVVQTIRDMLENTLEPGLLEAVSDAQGELDKAHQDIVACNQAATATEQAINSNEKAAKDNAQTDHEGCRTTEAAKLVVAEEKFARLESFRAKLDPPDEVDDPVAEQITYYESARDFFNTQTPILINLHGNSTAANVSFESQHEQCDSYQSTFETSFCVYRTVLNYASQAASTCYEEKKASFESEEGAKKTLEEDFVHEYTAIQKILCYLKVLLEESDDTTKRNGNTMCEAMNIVTEPVELVYPECPYAYLIDMEPVAVYPGEARFEAEYYADETLSYHDVTPCQTSGAPTQSTTQAPTPSTTQASSVQWILGAYQSEVSWKIDCNTWCERNSLKCNLDAMCSIDTEQKVRDVASAIGTSCDEVIEWEIAQSKVGSNSYTKKKFNPWMNNEWVATGVPTEAGTCYYSANPTACETTCDAFIYGGYYRFCACSPDI
jgi:hypothetical protein